MRKILTILIILVNICGLSCFNNDVHINNDNSRQCYITEINSDYELCYTESKSGRRLSETTLPLLLFVYAVIMEMRSGKESLFMQKQVFLYKCPLENVKQYARGTLTIEHLFSNMIISLLGRVDFTGENKWKKIGIDCEKKLLGLLTG